MNCIVNVDNNWAIGFKNNLLVRIPADMRMFRNETTGKVVVMGRNTLESFPSGKPLPNRTNIVITHDKNYNVNGAITVNSVEEALELIKEYDSDDIFFIGGASIYKQCLQFCDVCHVTKVDYEYQADTYFPNLDKMDEWEIVDDSEEQTYYDLEYRFIKYERKNK